MKNIELTKNFKLYEFINAQMPIEAKMMNWSEINKMDKEEKSKLISNLTDLAKEMQKIRDKYNKPIHITSGYRCIEWEKYRSRTGASQHVFGIACDFIVNDQQIMKSIMNDYKTWMGGLACKIRNDKYIFIHLDLRMPQPKHIERGFGARWEY